MKKKIWIFHPYATPTEIIGLTRPYDLSKELKKRGYEVTIFGSSYLHYISKNLINDQKMYISEKYEGIEFIFIKTRTYTNNGIERIKNFIDYYINLNKYIKKLGKKDIPDIIYASSPHPLALLSGIKNSRKLKIPCIGEIRDFWPEVFFLGGKFKEKSLIGKLLLKGEKYLYKNLNALIFLKEGDKEYIKEHKWSLEQGGDIDLKKIYYINNGVDLDEFDKNLNEYKYQDEDLESEKFKIIYIGAIRKVNNIERILEVAKKIKMEEIEFLIFGDGNERAILELKCKKEGIDNVKFKGYVEKKYIPYILSKANLNILNYSQSEYNWKRGNSSNKLFEYMASGKPILSTVKMGYSIIEKYKCGLELETENIDEFYHKILEMKNMTKEKYRLMGLNARNGVKNFTYERLGEKLLEVIEKEVSKC